MTVGICQDDAANPAIWIDCQFMYRGVVRYRCACFASCVDQNAIKHGASTRDQSWYARLQADRYRNFFISIMEGAGMDYRRATADDGVEQAPARELHDGRSHQGVRRKRVRAIRLAIDGKHP